MTQNEKNLMKQKFSILSDMITNAERTIISSLQTELERTGEQDMFYYEDEKIVPISYINDDGDAGIIDIDKIRVENGSVEIHEAFDDEWYPLAMLDTTAMLILINYIDWN